MDCSLLGSSIHGILQARLLNWVAIAFSECLGYSASKEHYLFSNCKYVLEAKQYGNSKSIKMKFSSVQSLSHVQLFATPWIAARQASLSITNSQSSLKVMSIELVMPSSHLILCRPLFLLPPVPPSIKVFSNESTLRMRCPKYWSFGFSIIPSKEHPGLISFRMDWLRTPISVAIEIYTVNILSLLFYLNVYYIYMCVCVCVCVI